MRLLNSTRSLVVSPTPKLNKRDAVLFGGIRYEEQPSDAVVIAGNAVVTAAAFERSLSFISLTGDLRGDSSWNYLPGTEAETENIAAQLRARQFAVDLKQDYEASETAFKQIGQSGPSPRILHIATHGFFFPDPEDSLKPTVRQEEEPAFKLSDDPMIRSGLLLAGANAAWAGKAPKEGHEDGILTAYEISLMNLRSTELVVLSACETGLGDIAGSEGVYGLQRAFKIAGAKYLIMSLWQVPDRTTQEFMTTFYREWLGGKSIYQAFSDTRQLMQELYNDPYAWAGFVLIE